MAKIAIINARNVFPLNGGDKIFSYNLLKILASQNDVCYINIIDEGLYHEKEKKELSSGGHISLKIIPTHFLNNFYAILKSSLWGIPYLAARRADKEKIKTRIQKYLSSFSPDIIVWDQIRSASYFTPFNSAKNFLVEHNDEAAIYRQRGASKNVLAKSFYNFQAGLLEKFDAKIHTLMDTVIYLNKDNIKENASAEKYRFFPNLFTSFPHAEYTVKEVSNIKLLFVGAMDWYPNADGIKWFIEKVFSLLPANFELLIVGRNAAKAFTGNDSTRIEIHSDVTSVEPFYLSADLFISPVFSGSGINIKILEAASYGIPFIATSFSLRGYNDLDFIPQAENEKAFAEKIIEYATYQKRVALNTKIIAWYHAYRQAAEASVQQLFIKN